MHKSYNIGILTLNNFKNDIYNLCTVPPLSSSLTGRFSKRGRASGRARRQARGATFPNSTKPCFERNNPPSPPPPPLCSPAADTGLPSLRCGPWSHLSSGKGGGGGGLNQKGWWQEGGGAGLPHVLSFLGTCVKAMFLEFAGGETVCGHQERRTLIEFLFPIFSLACLKKNTILLCNKNIFSVMIGNCSKNFFLKFHHLATPPPPPLSPPLSIMLTPPPPRPPPLLPPTLKNRIIT